MKVAILICIISLFVLIDAQSVQETHEDVENISDREEHESTEEDDDRLIQQSKEDNDEPSSEIKTQEVNDDTSDERSPQNNAEKMLVSNFNPYPSVPGERSFSFHNFNGPITKEVRQVEVPNSNPAQPGVRSIDFVGKPDYSFSYGVHDDKSQNSHTHMESRDGDALRGEYRVLQPDGLVRIVRYVEDPLAGFQMTVEYAKL